MSVLSTEQVVVEGVGRDSSWTCLMYGDRWMTWGADLRWPSSTSPRKASSDSVFCPAFSSATLT